MNFKGKHGPLLIAEIGGNHEGSFDAALNLVELAIQSDTDAIKFQIYTGDTLVSYVESIDRNLHFRKFELTPEQHIILAKRVRSAGIKYIASVWDVESLDWIDPYIDIYKIGSGDLTSHYILQKIALMHKPIIISTGLSYEYEVMEAINVLQNSNAIYKDDNMLAILQCTSMYPIKESDANLRVMSAFKAKTNLTVGFSNHLKGTYGMEIAFAAGAQVLEYHFTDSRSEKTFRDHQLSLTKEEVKSLITKIKKIERLMGSRIKEPISIELENNHTISFRRAIYPSVDIKSGEVFSLENLILLRPNVGIDARYLDKLIGQKAKVDVKRHESLNWDKVQ